MIRLGRRQFFGRVAATCVAGAAAGRSICGDERPAVMAPRATSGDTAVEPGWNERLTITVGPAAADIGGQSHRAIQAAVDYVARFGGGTVKLLPGEYRCRNAVYLASGVRLLGSGSDCVLIKEPSHTARLAVDSDWYDQEVTLDDDREFLVGDGVCLRATNPHNGGPTVLKRTLVARSGSRFKLDRPLRENLWLMGEAKVSTLFPLLSGEEVTDVVLENITLDGNRANNELLDGNYAGCIFLQDCSRITIRGVTARNYHGDGISWQVCHDVLVEDCHSHGHSGLGLHPGSGSQRPVIRGNRLEHNDIGIFFCWGVKYGLAENNTAVANRVGISIGHRDTDNLIRRNEVRDSGEVGVLFRPERGGAFCAHRNTLTANRIWNSGDEQGIGIDVQGATEDVTIQHNELHETRGAAQRIGIRLGAETRNIRLADNQINGFATDIASSPSG